MSVFLGIYAPITSATPNILCVYKRLETVRVKIRFRAPKKQCTFAQFVHLSGVSTSCGSDGNCELLMASLSCFMRSDFLVMCDLRETAKLNFVSFSFSWCQLSCRFLMIQLVNIAFLEDELESRFGIYTFTCTCTMMLSVSQNLNSSQCSSSSPGRRGFCTGQELESYWGCRHLHQLPLSWFVIDRHCRIWRLRRQSYFKPVPLTRSNDIEFPSSKRFKLFQVNSLILVVDGLGLQVDYAKRKMSTLPRCAEYFV